MRTMLSHLRIVPIRGEGAGMLKCLMFLVVDQGLLCRDPSGSSSLWAKKQGLAAWGWPQMDKGTTGG